MVNESKRCSNDLKWSHMPSNGSKKPPLAFFKKSPKFSGNFTPKNSGMKQIAAPLALISYLQSLLSFFSRLDVLGMRFSEASDMHASTVQSYSCPWQVCSLMLYFLKIL